MKKYSSNYCTINNNYIININKEVKRIKKAATKQYFVTASIL